MQGRIENKIKTENHIQNIIKDCPDFIKEYYYSLSSKTHTTKLRYISHVVRFLNYISEDVKSMTTNDLDNLTPMSIQRYIESINYYNKGNGVAELSSNTKAIIYSSINSLFEFLKKSDYISRSPFDNNRIQRPKVKENDVVFLTPEEVKLVEESILKSRDEYKYRDLLLFRIPTINGLRVTALSEINIEDIDFKDSSIKVVEKGNIEKSVYLDQKTMEYLRTWLTTRGRILGVSGCEKCKALFISNQKCRMVCRSIERIITKHTSKAIPNKHITPHKLRSTCGTNLYQAKKDIYLVASVLGHKSTAPTRRYTKVFDNDKRNAINTIAEIYN